MKHLVSLFTLFLLSASLPAQESAVTTNPAAILHTSLGDIQLELFADKHRSAWKTLLATPTVDFTRQQFFTG